jgi:hypothetical protein
MAQVHERTSWDNDCEVLLLRASNWRLHGARPGGQCHTKTQATLRQCHRQVHRLLFVCTGKVSGHTDGRLPCCLTAHWSRRPHSLHPQPSFAYCAILPTRGCPQSWWKEHTLHFGVHLDLASRLIPLSPWHGPALRYHRCRAASASAHICLLTMPVDRLHIPWAFVVDIHPRQQFKSS